jgi:flavin reductase (DIM6/NTAB) family NADH-FMN oxidoreductase RutF
MSISSEQYRDVMRHLPTGVTIVTIVAPGHKKPRGLTVSAFASISLEPPLIMIAIDRGASSHSLLAQEGAKFAVSILAEGESDLSNRFAFTIDEERFLEGEWRSEVTGAPILENALAWLDCTVYGSHEAGTHTLFIGHVVASGVPRADEAPLIYWNRGYRRLDLPGES